jgi:hypothetical protein
VVGQLGECPEHGPVSLEKEGLLLKVITGT